MVGQFDKAAIIFGVSFVFVESAPKALQHRQIKISNLLVHH